MSPQGLRRGFMAAATLVLALTGAGAASAQLMNAPDSPCAGVEVTSDLTACLYKAVQADDAILNRTFQDVVDVLTPAERARLRRVERLWLSYRDESCDAQHDMFGGGTAGPPAELACVEAEDRHRIAILEHGYGWRVRQRRRP